MKHMKESGVGTIVASELLRTITSTKMRTTHWNGAKRSFILSWQDNARRYHGLVPAELQLSSAFSKSVLQNVVQGFRELDGLRISE